MLVSSGGKVSPVNPPARGARTTGWWVPPCPRRGNLRSSTGAPRPQRGGQQVEGQRPQVRAQKALGYEPEVAIIQELSHLPYFFCWSHV